jgi:hypothetical protein
MSDVVAEHAARIRVADPQPARCSGCLQSAGTDVRFVDYQAAIDRGAIVEEGSMAVLESIDELYLCDSCVRQGAEALAFKPVEHRRLLTELRRTELERDHWKAYAGRLEATLQERPEAAPRARRR